MQWALETPSLLPEGTAESLGISPFLSFTVPGGALAHLLRGTGLDRLVGERLSTLQGDDADSLMVACFASRGAILKCELPPDLAEELSSAYAELGAKAGLPEALVTVRPAGHSVHEGGRHRGFPALTRALLTCYTDHLTRLVMHEGKRSLEAVLDSAPDLVVARSLGWHCSGVVCSYELKTGSGSFATVLSTWGLAEDILRKELARDEYLVHKPTLLQGHRSLVRKRPGHKEFRLDFDVSAGRMRHSEVSHERLRELTLQPEEALNLARAALLVEESLGAPVELDWGMEEGWTRGLHLLGARPADPPRPLPLRLYRLGDHGESLLRGKAVGNGLAVGKVRLVESRDQLDGLRPGEILVTRKTEPDWEPAFRLAGAIVTEQDTRVSHSTILARELGIPALLEASGSSLFLEDGQLVTVSCCQGEVGHVYAGEAEFSFEELDAERLPQLKTALSISLSMPERALAEARRPWAGAGLVRSEFIMTGWVRIHPMALLFPERLSLEVQGTLNRLCRGYSSKKEYFLEQMSQAVATVASAFWPRPVLLRLSDLKAHEYAKLVGGERFEPPESNPVLGFRGASRYIHPDYRPAFELELQALARVRHAMGMHNLHLMVPFCRTPQEAEEVLELMAEAGLPRGQDGLQVWMMAELPSNVVLAEAFAELFDGMSIGSNDLTQLTLGVDRDNRRVAAEFDEIHPAMMGCYQRVIDAGHAAGKTVGFCGQVASEDPLFCATLAEMGVDGISVAPDAFLASLDALRAGETPVTKGQCAVPPDEGFFPSSA
jgi:pyruvate,water dikinase